ncbi:MAG TPA: hypothetical protein PKV72_04720, partial [Candidatus Peribacteria bacterium]|nr:hypothetical protein [Candidatus Peribacteria bacterium]
MEHLFTSFFRSTAAGSFKEHRMVFQTATPGRIESVAVAEQRQKEMVDRLENPNDVQAAADARVLSVSLFLSRDLDPARIDAAKAALDARIVSRDAADKTLVDRTKVNAESLAALNKRYTDAPAGAPGDAARAAVVADMRTAIEASRTEVARLGGLAPADRPHNINAQITESRQQIVRLNTATFLTDAQRTELQRSDVSRLDPAAAGAGGGRDLLGQALLVKMEGLPTAAGESTFSADGVAAKFKFDAASGKWQVERAVVGGIAAVAYAEVTATSAHDLANAEFAGAPNAAKRAAAVRYNDMVTRLVSLNGGSRDQIVARENDRAGTELTASEAANNTFFRTTLVPLETELTAARATPGNAVRLEGATKDVREAFATRKTAILARIQAVSNLEPRPVPNLNTHLEALQTHWTQTIQNERRLLPPPAPTAAPTAAETLPDGERKSLEAFNKFLSDNPAVNGLTSVEGTRKPAIDAITTQLSTLNTSAALREQGRAALDAKLATKGYAVDTIAFAPAALTLRTVSATPTETLPEPERKALEAFNKFLADNPAVNGLTAVEGTRKPAIDAIVAQLGTMNLSPSLREQGRLVLDAKLRTKGYAVDTIAFAPAALTLRAVPVEAPATPAEAVRLGTDADRTALTTAINTNRGNLNSPGVRTAMQPFEKQVATLPGPQQAPAVQRLSAELGIRPTATTEGVEFALVGTTIEARTVARLPAGGTAPERKERNARMSEFIKVIMELLRALLQIEQARSASIDRFLTRSLEQQQKFMNDMQGEMNAIAARPGGTAAPEYIRLQGQYKEAQGQIKSLEARVKEMEGG